MRGHGALEVQLQLSHGTALESTPPKKPTASEMLEGASRMGRAALEKPEPTGQGAPEDTTNRSSRSTRHGVDTVPPRDTPTDCTEEEEDRLNDVTA